jgi:TonB family protein
VLALPAVVSVPTPARRLEESGFTETLLSEKKSRSRTFQDGTFNNEPVSERSKGGRSISVSGSGFETGAAPVASGGTGRRGIEASAFAPATSAGFLAKAQPREFQAAGFEQPPNVPASAPNRIVEAAKLDPPEILSKPNPIYTLEAKAARIEGEVLIKVNLRSNGEVQILGILKGLGHGLDEAAEKAAAQIRFRPASKAGISVDYTTTLRIIFQLG